MAGAFVAGTPRPCPLVATAFNVSIDAGLAVVEMRRTFRNAEADAIEATITFPLPVQAILFGLEARVDGRVLKGHAARKTAARQTYEDAIDRGKASVLHEEVLRGVHMLSLGQIAPGAETEVRAVWAMTLTWLDGRGRLRIPLTVGDIYGRSGLADSDELISGGPMQRGTLTVTSQNAPVTLIGGRLEEGRAVIPLNRPIDLDVGTWTARELRGRMADGRAVALRIAPAAGRDAALDAALLLDHSGSMGESCGAPSGVTKHEAALVALDTLASELGAADAIDLWEFDDKLEHIGSTREIPLRELARRLGGPDGGTEIGKAIAGVMARAAARDIILVTDGKSHALDVQALARSGRRFSIVLVGADSLEAHVGHLAALTRGEIFVSAGADLPALLAAAARSLRVPHVAPLFDPHEMRERRAGLEIVATWNETAAAGEPTREQRAVAALAASLVLPTLDADAAAQFAEAEGLVTHLTSLVLVDEDAAALEGIPATRKIALPAPAGDFSLLQEDVGPVAACAPAAAAPRRMYLRSIDVGVDDEDRARARRWYEEHQTGAAAPEAPQAQRPVEEAAVWREAASVDRRGGRASGRAPRESLLGRLRSLFDGAPGDPPRTGDDLDILSARVDWDASPARLQAGDLAGLAPAIADEIRRLAADPEVVRAARDFGLDPVVLVIGLLARHVAARSRAAERLARAILGARSTADLERAIARSLQTS